MKVFARYIILTISIVIVAVIATGPSPSQSVAADVSPRLWDSPATVHFDNTDTLTQRNLDLTLRYNDHFAGDTLTLRITTHTPDSLHCEERLLLLASRSYTPSPIARSAQIPYRRHAVFSRPGRYSISIAPTRPVKGVETVGINIVKSEYGQR